MAILNVLFNKVKTGLVMLLTIAVFSCDAPNRSSERGAGSEIEERAPVDPADTSSVEKDTTSSSEGNQNDTLR